MPNIETKPAGYFHSPASDPDALSASVSKPAWQVKYEPLERGAKFRHSVTLSTTGSLVALRPQSRYGFRADMTMDKIEQSSAQVGQIITVRGDQAARFERSLTSVSCPTERKGRRDCKHDPLTFTQRRD